MAASLYVVTGASRGLGEAIAGQLVAPADTLLCISRGRSERLQALASRNGVTLHQWQRDLAQPAPVADELEAWLRSLAPAAFGAAALVNNAGVLARVGPADSVPAAEAAAALRTGLEAAVLLTAAFLRATRGWPALAAGQVRVLNISSGLGRRAMAGSALYCAAKAGVDHFSRAVALDEAHRCATQGAGARIASLAPGVIETSMQEQLRAASAQGFPDQPRFLDLHAQGLLATPEEAAARVVAYLRRADFGSQPVADVREEA